VGVRAGKAADTLVLTADPKTWPHREWLEGTLLIPGRPERPVRRDLVSPPGSATLDDLLVHRRYSLGVFPGSVPLAALEEQLAQARGLPLAQWQADSEKLSKQRGPETAKVLAPIESAAGRLAGHLLPLMHAQAADALSERTARSLRVTVVRDQPRILIATQETVAPADSGSGNPGSEDAQMRTRVSLDLRLDEVRAYPWPGQASGAATLFQRSRGLFSSVIEGRVVAAATGEEPTTTAALMDRALAEGVELVTVDASNQGQQLRRIQDLQGPARNLLVAALQSGREAVIPVRAVSLGGRPRLGWWELDPETGATVGVMDDGLHQGMVEYNLNLEKIGLNEKMGFAIGSIIGTTAIRFLLIARILEHGAVNQQIIKEIKDMAEGILCLSCPKAEAKASISFSVGDDCLKYEYEKSIGVSAKIGFCEYYVQGFKCAMKAVLAPYQDDPGLQAEAKAEITATIMCKDYPDPKEGSK